MAAIHNWTEENHDHPPPTAWCRDALAKMPKVFEKGVVFQTAHWYREFIQVHWYRTKREHQRCAVVLKTIENRRQRVSKMHNHCPKASRAVGGGRDLVPNAGGGSQWIGPSGITCEVVAVESDNNQN